MKGGVVVMFLLVVVEVTSSMSTMAGAGAEEPDLPLAVLYEDDDRPELSLTELNSTKYRAFVGRVRELLGTTQFTLVPELRLLRSPASVSWAERFVMVDIRNYDDQSVTLVLNVTNVYVVGYVVGSVSVFIMPDDPEMQAQINGGYLFPGTTHGDTLPFTGGYDALERAARQIRENIPLGGAALDTSVTSMRLYATTPTPFILNTVARALIVCIQMVSEAARFPRIQFGVSMRIPESQEAGPDPVMLRLENAWSDLSEAIQTSNNGVFARPVRLQQRDYSWHDVLDVQTAARLIALLLYYCQPAPKEELVHHHRPAAVIRFVVDKPQAECTVIRFVVDKPQAECPAIRFVVDKPQAECPGNVEPKVRIIGAGGLCVDVRNGSYNNGNPIQLWPCDSHGDEKQLWTFRTDGTLRSNGKCMASFGDTPRDYIMIYDCEPGAAKYTWRWWINGTISSATGLRLSTYSSNPGTTLSARVEAFNPGQSWLPTNETQPLVSQIAGHFGRCLHANGDDVVLLQGCAAVEAASFWILYPDSTIRPQRRTSTCLTAQAQAGNYLVTTSCNPNHALQRWLLANDGSIINLDQGLVMDIREPGGASLTINPFDGTDEQIWQALL